MIHDSKPPLDEALLEHHGVKGMKWGSRKARTAEIHKARSRYYTEKENIRKQKKLVRLASRPETKAARQAKLHELKVAHFKNPDRVTARKITAGDVFLHTLLLGPLATVSLGTATAQRFIIKGQQHYANM